MALMQTPDAASVISRMLTQYDSASPRERDWLLIRLWTEILRSAYEAVLLLLRPARCGYHTGLQTRSSQELKLVIFPNVGIFI
jgi:hypothetical protein